MFIKIDNIKDYVNKNLQNKEIFLAKKSSRIIARKGNLGEEIKTFVENGTMETINKVKKINGQIDVVITNANIDGSPIIYKNGNTNTYIIPFETFDKKYEFDFESKYGNIYRPKGEAQKFVEIHEDIEILASWGEKQFLKSGSFLNISNKEDIYGIAREEFLKTYTRV